MGEDRATHGSWAAQGDPAYADLLRAQEAFEFAPDAQVRTDFAGVLVAANYAATDLLRCPKEFLPGKPLGLFVAEGHRAEFYNTLIRAIKGDVAAAVETRLARRGGPPRDVSAVVVLGPAGGLHWRFTDVTEQRKAESTRDELLQRLATAQEDERRRVARDLHDTVGQTLTALLLGLRAVEAAGPLPPAAAEKLAAARRLAGDLGRQLHDIAVRLRPASLDDLGLGAAAAQLVADWSARTGVPADFRGPAADAARLPPEVETALYRVVQEALTNVAKHAAARRVGVLIGRDGSAVAVVEDDGRGFDPDAVTPTSGRRPLGLVGMRERVALLGGALEIESAPGRGTTVFARIPLPDG